jgi:hypothetical protein
MLLVLVAVIAVAGTVCGVATAAPQEVHVWLTASSPILSGRDLTVSGGIDAEADLSGAKVSLYKREVGEIVDTLVAETPITYSLMTGNVFRTVVPDLVRSCIVTVVWAGDADHVAASAWVFAGVKSRLTVNVPVATRKETRVRIVVSPEQPFARQGMMRPPFIADVQCRLHGVWKRFPADLGTASTNGTSWCTYRYFKVKPGTYVIRGRFAGTNYNVASFTKVMRIVVP